MYLTDGVSLCGKALYGGYRNSRTGDNPSIMTHIPGPRHLSDFVFPSEVEGPYVASGVINNDAEYYPNDILIPNDLPAFICSGFHKYHATIQNKQLRFSPFRRGHLRKVFGNLSEVLQGNTILITENIEYAQRSHICERIDSAVGNPPVLTGKRWREEVGSIPISKLSLRYSGQSFNLLLAER